LAVIVRVFALLTLGLILSAGTTVKAAGEDAKPAPMHEPQVKPPAPVAKRPRPAASAAQRKSTTSLQPVIKQLAAAKRGSASICNAAPALGRPSGHFGWAGYLSDSPARDGTPCMFTHWDFAGRPLNGDYTRYFYEITASRLVLAWPLTAGHGGVGTAKLSDNLTSSGSLDYDNVNGTVSINQPSPADDTASVIQPAFSTNQYYAGLIEDHPASLPTIQIGSVTWVNAAQVAGAHEPTAVASIAIKPPDLTVRISMCCRPTAGSPAQLAFDITVASPSGQDAVVKVGNPEMRRTGNIHGDALAGNVTQQSPGQFHIALSDTPSDRENNMKLLLTRVWIDIPLDFASGKRAILTFTTGKVGIDTIYAALH
jgi:hypothetical protein